MNPSPQLLAVLRWLGLAEALLAVAAGVFGEELLYLPPSLGPWLTALIFAGVAFAAYSWFSPRKLWVLFATAGMLCIAAANLVVALFLGERYVATIEADPDAIYRLIPGTVKLSRNPEGEWIRWRVNSSGFRGFEIDPAARNKVMVYGDSFVNADFSRLEDSFPVKLEDELSQRLGEPVEVINAGVRGYGPDQSLRRMQRELPVLRPRLTLLVLFAGNDFGDLLRNRIYRLAASGELELNKLVLSSNVRRALDGARKRPVLLNMVDQAWQIWRSSRWVPTVEIQVEARQHEYNDYVIEGKREVDNIGDDSGDLDVAVDPDSPSAAYKIRLMEQVLARCAQVAKECDSAFAVVIVGRTQDLTGDTAIDLAQYPKYHPSNLTGILESIARRQQIRCLNTYGSFQRAGAGSVYFLANKDYHWNAGGQRLAAKLAAELVTAGEPPLLAP